MGLLSHRVKRTQINAGDHIYTWRTLYSYSHHGIYAGGNKVIHFTLQKDASSGVDSSFGSSYLSTGIPPTCPIPDCGFRKPNSGVVLSCLDCFLGNGSLYNFEYGVDSFLFFVKVRSGTCTTAVSDPPLTVIFRAMYLLHYGFGKYNIFENNCEDFALYCKTGLLTYEELGRKKELLGRGKSGQVHSFLSFPGAVIKSSLIKLFMASPTGMAVATAWLYYSNKYYTDIGVRKDVVKVAVENMPVNHRRRAKEKMVSDGVVSQGGSGEHACKP